MLTKCIDCPAEFGPINDDERRCPTCQRLEDLERGVRALEGQLGRVQDVLGNQQGTIRDLLAVIKKQVRKDVVDELMKPGPN